MAALAHDRFAALLSDAPASMTVRQVATALSISEHVVRRLLTTSELEGVKVGREWRVLRTDLLSYLEQRSNRSVDAR
ncbi:helix-turn-helix domain-containing protein [Brachybacterium alimentarium]|uniref:helix-turn-helix domain-containing protein n=1 Tax=Brachybacterium alimentarium TaxID=47845 RepID=UPI0011C04300